MDVVHGCRRYTWLQAGENSTEGAGCRWVLGAGCRVLGAAPGTRHLAPSTYRRYAISGVSVSGLKSVEMKTALVTKSGERSNSSARIVVATATGIDESVTAAWRAAPVTIEHAGKPDGDDGGHRERHHHGGADDKRSGRRGRALELHAEDDDHHRQRGVTEEPDGSHHRRRH